MPRRNQNGSKPNTSRIIKLNYSELLKNLKQEYASSKGSNVQKTERN